MPPPATSSRRSRLLWALVGAAWAGPSCRTQPVRDAAFVANAAVVSVVSRGSEGSGLGSGFFVGPERVATCLHCVDGDGDVRVRLADRREARVVGVLAEDREHDLVLLAVEPIARAPAPLEVALEPVSEGASLTAVGSYQGRAQSSARVVVTAGESPRTRLGTAFRAQGEIGPGSSGCPLLDAEGRVRGVVSERDVSSPSTGWAVPGRFVAALAPGTLEPIAAFGARTARNPELPRRRAFEAALLRFQAGDTEGARRSAERVYREAGAAGGTYVWASAGLVRDALLRQGSQMEAVAWMQEVAAQHPAEAEPAMGLGALLWGLERREEALTAYRDAVRRAPDLAAAHAALAARLWTAGRGAEAQVEARAVLVLDPSHVPAREILGSALAAEERYTEALGPLEAGARLAPGDAEARGNLGAVLANLGRHAEARGHLEQAVRLAPREPTWHADLARVHLGLGDPPAARRERDLLLGLDLEAAAEVSVLIAAAERPAPVRVTPPPVSGPPIPRAPPVSGALPPPVVRPLR